MYYKEYKETIESEKDVDVKNAMMEDVMASLFDIIGTEIKHNALFCQRRIGAEKIYNVEMCKDCYEKFYEIYKEFAESKIDVEQEEQ